MLHCAHIRSTVENCGKRRTQRTHRWTIVKHVCYHRIAQSNPTYCAHRNFVKDFQLVLMSIKITTGLSKILWKNSPELCALKHFFDTLLRLLSLTWSFYVLNKHRLISGSIRPFPRVQYQGHVHEPSHWSRWRCSAPILSPLAKSIKTPEQIGNKIAGRFHLFFFKRHKRKGLKFYLFLSNFLTSTELLLSPRLAISWGLTGLFFKSQDQSLFLQ